MGWSAWLSLARSGAGLTAAVAPTPGMRLAWRELANKLAAYELYRSAEECLPRGAAGAPLAEAARSALALGPRRSPWVLEGIAFARAEAVAGSTPEAGGVPGEAGPGGLLNGSAAGELPAAALLPLHTGAGLAWARRALAGLGSAPADAELGRALGRFLALCRAHSRPEYLEAALEAVGLVARTLYPHLVGRLARAARAAEAGAHAAADADLEALLWHGAGRGLYFTPAHVVPVFDPAGRALRAAASEPEDRSGRANAVAGVAWAATLVNLHDPEVLAGLLDGLDGIDPAGAAPEAFADGVASALVLRLDVTGRDPDLEAFLAFRPACGACRRAALWERLVRRPAERALAHRHPELRRRRALGELFRVADPSRDPRREDR